MSPGLDADWMGWVAAGLTLSSFACSDMLRLRVLALAANAAFASYGWHAGLVPVLALHLALAPVNAWRIAQLLRVRLSPRVFKPPLLCKPAQPARHPGSL